LAYPTHLAVLCAALLLAAALSDALLRRIPNALCVAILATGLGAQWASRGSRGLAAGVAAAAIAGGILTVPWWRRMVGGGDLKLAAASGAWVGTAGLPLFLLAAALAGGAVSAAVMFTRTREVLPRAPPSALTAALARRSAAARRGVTAPYGVAIAAGALAALVGAP
jgi:prepilin peptidase CpaA